MNAKGTFTDLTVSGATIGFPGSIGFDHGLWIADQSGPSGKSVMYQITPTGSTLSVTGTTQLDKSDDCIPITFKKNAICASGNILLYHYPTGGNPHRTIKASLQGIGSAISG